MDFYPSVYRTITYHLCISFRDPEQVSLSVVETQEPYEPPGNSRAVVKPELEPMESEPSNTSDGPIEVLPPQVSKVMEEFMLFASELERDLRTQGMLYDLERPEPLPRGGTGILSRIFGFGRAKAINITSRSEKSLKRNFTSREM